MAVRRDVSATGPGGPSHQIPAARAESGGKPSAFLAPSTYAATIRQAMTACNVTAAELASAAGYSYEQIRRVLKGEPIVSDQLNQLLCARLSLDGPVMWRLAQHEKNLRRLASSADGAPVSGEGDGLLAAFARLGAADQRRVLRLVRRLEVEQGETRSSRPAR